MGYEALEAAGVMQIRRQPYLDFYGQGVIVGFVDTGIDFTHEAFRNADGTTRIHSIWDQTIREGGPSQFDYGRVFSEREINEALRREQPSSYLPTRDDIGHGTFLAGVAAGNEIPGKEFSGIAPLSQIIVVKCKEAKTVTANITACRQKFPVIRKMILWQELCIFCKWRILWGDRSQSASAWGVILEIMTEPLRSVISSTSIIWQGQVSSPAPEMKVPPGIIIKLPKRKKKFRSTLRGRVLDLSANCGGRLPEVCRLM